MCYPTGTAAPTGAHLPTPLRPAPAMRTHSAVFTPPCTSPTLRVPGAGRQLCPAQHSQTPRHRDTVRSSGLPTAPSSLPAHPSPPQPQPPPDPGDPAQCSWLSSSARFLEPVFYGPTQHLRINADPHFIWFWSNKGELTQLHLCNCSPPQPGAGWKRRAGTGDPGTQCPSLTVPGSARGRWGCSFLVLFVTGKSPRGPPAVTSSSAQR